MTAVAEVETEDRLAPFREMNARSKTRGDDVPWETRLEMIHRQFPSTRPGFDWNAALMDWELLARIWRDILKLDARQPGRRGARPPLDPEDAKAAWFRLTGQDYSEKPFVESFAALTFMGGRRRSLSHVASLTGLARSRVHRLLKGEIEPTIDDLRSIAAGFKKHPSFFAEYRAAYITAAVYQRLAVTPDASIRLYTTLVTEQ